MNQRRTNFPGLCLAEPFRIFFPLATLLGISGVSLWPLFFSGLHKFYPGVMHSRLMIQGFLAGYVIGFLGTAIPRLLSAPHLRAWELWSLIALHLTAAGLHIGHQTALGDGVFVALLSFFGVLLIRRISHRSELPPPGFVLVALGYLTGLVGTVLWLAGMKGWVSGQAMGLGGLWLNQGFALLLILGVGSFLIPRFLGVAVPDTDDQRSASPAWCRRALFALVVGCVFACSFVVEAYFATGGIPAALRGSAAVAYLLVTTRLWKTSRPRETISLATNFSIATLLIGVAFPLFFPSQRLAGLHVIFIGGMSLIMFTVATRVVLGHSGQEHLSHSRLPSLRIVMALLMISTVLRAMGDFYFQSRTGMLNWASYLWMMAAAAWGTAILPKVRVPDTSDDESCTGQSNTGPVLPK
jgi:uncharacterized protein involved in response to NO